MWNNLAGMLNAGAPAGFAAVVPVALGGDVGIFRFEGMVSPACQVSYVQMFEDLAALPTGLNLLREVVTHCRHPAATIDHVTLIENKPVPDGDASAFYPRTLEVNIKWAGGAHVGSNRVLLANDGGGGIRFVGVNVPPVCVLAHELGHLLYALQTPIGASSLLFRMTTRAQLMYTSVIMATNGIPGPPLANLAAYDTNSIARKAFLNMWANNNAIELVNILPIERILLGAGAVFGPGDGAFLKEAYDVGVAGNARCLTTFFDLHTGAQLTLAAAPVVTSEHFIRLTHVDVVSFRTILNNMWWFSRNEFMQVVSDLLGKIRVAAGGPLTINALPQFMPPPNRHVCNVV